MNNAFPIGPITSQIIHQIDIPIRRQPHNLGVSFCPSWPRSLENGPPIEATDRSIRMTNPATIQWKISITGERINPVKEAEASEPIP